MAQTRSEMTPHFAIGGRVIGAGQPVYVIAELSANHHRELETAKALVHAAASAGADAVKLQTYTADTITLDVRSAPFRIDHGTVWDGAILHDLYAQAATPWEWHAELFALAQGLGLQAFSTPFDRTAVRFLADLNVPAYKVASFELVDIPLLQTIAAERKPMIVSTGMATLDEIEEAVLAIRAVAPVPLALLRTSSAYPANAGDVDLRSIQALARTFAVVAGLSDHTLGRAVPVAAAALGAHIIEKHLTLSRARPGPDSAFSLEPREFTEMVAAVRSVEPDASAREPEQNVRFGPSESERAGLPFRRSLFVVQDVAAGALLTEDNVRSIRPSGGLHPRHLPEVLGRKAARDLPRGTPMSWDLID
jgi:N-acetylneuraminate synthase